MKRSFRNSAWCGLLIGIALLSAVSCKTSSRTATVEKKDPSGKLTQAEQLQLTALFIDANREKSLGNVDKALGLFSQCLKRNNNYAPAMYETANLLTGKGQHKEALDMISAAVRVEPENEWYQLLQAKIYLHLRDYSGAAKTMAQLNGQHPEHSDYAFNLADIFIMDGEYSEAIKVYDDIEKNFGISEDVSMQKEKLWMQLNKPNKAIEEIEKLVKEFPAEDKYMILLGDLYLTTGNEFKGLNMYGQLLKNNPTDPYVHISLADYYKMQGKEDKSFEELKLAFSSPELEIDTKIRILLQYFQHSENNAVLLEQAYTLCSITTTVHPEEAKAWSIYGDFLNREKRTAEAADVFRKVIQLDPNRYAVWEELMYMESALGQTDSLLRESALAMELFPEQAEPYLYNGFANIRQKNYPAAIKVLKQGLPFAGGTNLLMKFYANLAEAHYMQLEPDPAFEYYEKALKLEPDNTFLLNNYSYFMALQKKNLSRAEELSHRLIKLAPNVGTYEDTYAWVLFMQEKYEPARQMLEQALTHGGASNPAILEHYGDVLFKLGDREKALEYWQKAKNAGASSEVLIKKINTQTWHEK